MAGTHSRIRAQFDEWITEALAKSAPDEDLQWDTQIMVVPTEGGGQTVGMGIVIIAKGTFPIGSTIPLVMSINDITKFGQDGINDSIRAAVEGIRQARSNQLSSISADAIRETQNGHPPGGLAMPGLSE